MKYVYLIVFAWVAGQKEVFDYQTYSNKQFAQNRADQMNSRDKSIIHDGTFEVLQMSVN
ncbi:hypothetical protein [Oenococcus sicerae]|uniref:hypothetical protein n=1 Tax=Oenococcus sicerae TaxID=2203724 RepID=UPI00265B4381|nr:hypothetical protein [Oenococcus sicerae]